MDTLERLFAMRYYDSEEAFAQLAHQFFEEEGTSLVVAQRDERSLPTKPMEIQGQNLLDDRLIKPWVQKGKVAVWDAGDVLAQCSSTAVRSLYRERSDGQQQQARNKLNSCVVPSVVEYLETEQVYGPAIGSQ